MQVGQAPGHFFLNPSQALFLVLSALVEACDTLLHAVFHLAKNIVFEVEAVNFENTRGVQFHVSWVLSQDADRIIYLSKLGSQVCGDLVGEAQVFLTL